MKKLFLFIRITFMNIDLEGSEESASISFPIINHFGDYVEEASHFLANIKPNQPLSDFEIAKLNEFSASLNNYNAKLRELSKKSPANQAKVMGEHAHSIASPLFVFQNYIKFLKFNQFEQRSSVEEIEAMRNSLRLISDFIKKLDSALKLESIPIIPTNIQLFWRELYQSIYGFVSTDKLNKIWWGEFNNSSKICPMNKELLIEAVSLLTENAVKYSPDIVEEEPLSGLPIPLILIKCQVINNHFQIEVSNRGYGIPEDEGHAIYRPNYRATNTKDIIAGTGLGLSRVKDIVDIHNGKISHSDKRQPRSVYHLTTFTIQIPIDINFEG